MDYLNDLVDVHRRLGLTPEHIRKLIMRGVIKGVQPSGRHGKWFVAESEVERLTKPHICELRGDLERSNTAVPPPPQAGQ